MNALKLFRFVLKPLRYFIQELFHEGIHKKIKIISEQFENIHGKYHNSACVSILATTI